MNRIEDYLSACPSEVELVGTDMIFEILNRPFTDRKFVIQLKQILVVTKLMLQIVKPQQKVIGPRVTVCT
jgi:hypothetical protein